MVYIRVPMLLSTNISYVILYMHVTTVCDHLAKPVNITLTSQICALLA